MGWGTLTDGTIASLLLYENLDLVEISAVGLSDTAHTDTKYRHGASNANNDIFNR